MLNQFIIVAVAHFLAVISPGPDFFIISRQSLLYGRKAAIYKSFGITFGILIHVSYCVLGFDFILNNELVFAAIKIFCSIYLFYLGTLSILSYKKNTKNINNDNEFALNISNFSSFKIGFLTNLLNLKATLFFLSIFSFINSSGEASFLVQVFYGCWMVLVTGFWFLILSYFLLFKS